MSTALRDGIQRLEVTSRVTIGVLALASGVYTYLGVRELLNGNTTTVFFAAVIYSVAVTIGIFAFWSFLMRLLPHVLDYTGRFLLFLAMLLGSVMIIAMSAWLNASALAGAAALEQHLANTLQSYSRDLDQAHRYALSAQGLLPDIQMASARFSQLAEGEKTGTLTGTSGSGTVVQLLSQMSNQLATLSRTVDRSGEQVKALYEQGESTSPRCESWSRAAARSDRAATPLAPRRRPCSESSLRCSRPRSPPPSSGPPMISPRASSRRPPAAAAPISPSARPLS